MVRQWQDSRYQACRAFGGHCTMCNRIQESWFRTPDSGAELRIIFWNSEVGSFSKSNARLSCGRQETFRRWVDRVELQCLPAQASGILTIKWQQKTGALCIARAPANALKKINVTLSRSNADRFSTKRLGIGWFIQPKSALQRFCLWSPGLSSGNLPCSALHSRIYTLRGSLALSMLNLTKLDELSWH